MSLRREKMRRWWRESPRSGGTLPTACEFSSVPSCNAEGCTDLTGTSTYASHLHESTKSPLKFVWRVGGGVVRTWIQSLCKSHYLVEITYIVNGADINLSICEGPYNLESSLCFGLLSKFIRLSSRSSRVFSFSNWILAPGITENASVDSDLTVRIPLSYWLANTASSSYEALLPYSVLFARSLLFL